MNPSQLGRSLNQILMFQLIDISIDISMKNDIINHIRSKTLNCAPSQITSGFIRSNCLRSPSHKLQEVDLRAVSNHIRFKTLNQ